MGRKQLQKLRKQQYLHIIKSCKYKNELDEMAKRIVNLSKGAPNEATIESNFDCELFAFFRNTFGELGFEYNPIKEKSLNTARNVLNGRADTAIASLIIEFKQPTTLHNGKQREKAINQIKDYMKATSLESGETCQGFVTDGVIGCFLQFSDDDYEIEKFYKITGETLDRIIQCIVQVKLLALNAKNLVDSICNTPSNNGIGFKIAHSLLDIVTSNIHPKTEMLYDEWRQLFNLAHDDISKQQAIIDRRKSLEICFGKKFTAIDDEYKALFCLQTAYAIIVKTIAFKVLSQARYNTSLINFYDSMDMESEAMRMQLSDLEDGAIFIQYGITNLLEGDFFSWYTNDHQWNSTLADNISELYEILSRYADTAVITSLSKSQDFFKELYQTMIPGAVRHSLGEYYTKKWLADSVVEEALVDVDDNWKALDPCCGSGTFLTVLIDKIIKTSQKRGEELLDEIISRVKGIDLNPIAALTARVNYFINVANYIDSNKQLEIPVYLGDSSYVPKEVLVDGVRCLQYTITTIKKPIDILVPESMVENTSLFSSSMNNVETHIKNLDTDSVYNTFISLVAPEDLTETTRANLKNLAEQLVALESRKWNGVWARIITNFLTTANLGKFDIIVGNPPWVDWKSLPSGYRDKIKSLCISRNLFSGDVVTGGINLNICALITNVAAQNWLSDKGIIAFLMPEPLVFQQSYEGFRNLYMNDDERLFFYKFVNWNKAGHPFSPVTQKFLTYYIGHNEVDYNRGVSTISYVKKVRNNIDDIEVLDFECIFEKENNLLATCHPEKNFFTYVDSEETANKYRKMSGESVYIGREGIEFYPQELMVFTVADVETPKGLTALTNIQNKKSKYRVPSRTVLLETKYLHPMIKGKDITPFHVECSNYVVPFPYEKENPQIPIALKRLSGIAPNLAKYYQSNKKLLVGQTGYNDRIIGKKEAEFYALARVGAYSYAPHYVTFRDNTKWAAAVVSEFDTGWGGEKRPVFQNHAVSICENGDGGFITLDEAHYICGIMNTEIVAKYMMTSSDSRSFPIRPRVKIPKYDVANIVHKRISELSKEAHKKYNNEDQIKEIVLEIEELYLSIL